MTENERKHFAYWGANTMIQRIEQLWTELDEEKRAILFMLKRDRDHYYSTPSVFDAPVKAPQTDANVAYAAGVDSVIKQMGLLLDHSKGEEKQAALWVLKEILVGPYKVEK